MERSWLLQLQCDWREHASEEFPGEGRLLPVQSWYLHHHDAPRCQVPRLVQLDRMDHLWLADLRAAWSDRLRPGEVLHLSYIAPQPPRPDHAPFAPHIILSQGAVADRVSAIFTTRFSENHRTQLLQEAISVPNWMCGSRAVDLARVTPFVAKRRWIVRSGIMQFQTDELEEIPDGVSIVIDIRVDPPADAPPEGDEVTLAAWARQVYSP
eukprot:s1878_g26.t1